MNNKLYSFDIFDTVLTRLVSRPEHVFSIMEERLSDEEDKWKGFAKARISAELEVRRSKQFQKEITFNEIYEKLANDLSLSDDEIESLKLLEMEIEASLLYPVPEIKNEIQSLVKEKMKFIYISDMYLPDSFIISILKNYDLWGDNTILYLSSTTGKMKATGELFRYALEQEHISARNLLHIGDNATSDLKNPRELGIKVKLYKAVAFNRYEHSILGSNTMPELSRSKLAALLRYARLSCPYEDNHRKTIWNLSVNVSGLLLVSYAAWCLKRAYEMGLTRLYFLARDGQALLKIASIINKQLKYNIELRYLYASRQALLLPAVTEVDNEALEWIMAPTSTLTLRMIFKRVDIDIHDIVVLLKKNGFSEKDFDRHIEQEERPKVRALILDKDIKNLILKRAEHHRALTSGYLSQEGLFDDEKYAVIDIGWNGTLQRSISKLVGLSGKSFPVRGLYFGVRSRKTHKQEDVMEAFFSDHENPDPIEKITYIVPMMELFVAADHGGVRYFKKMGNSYVPVFKNEKNNTGLKWGIDVQHCAYEQLSHLFTRERSCYNLGRQEISILLNIFLTSPDKDEARVFGAYMDAEDQNESYHKLLAEKYSAIELIMYKLKNYKHHHNEWDAGSLQLSSQLLKKLLGI